MTLYKNQPESKNNFLRYLMCLFVYQSLLINYQSFAQESYKLNEIEINRVTNFEEENSAFPTNPFEIVDAIRRANSMNDATKPSDTIDDAIKSFDMIIEEKQI